MSSPQFQLDLTRGKVAEDYVSGMFKSWGAKVIAQDGYFPDYDLTVNGQTVEVKYDKKAEQTGNFCLELEALSHSKAQLLVIVTDNPRTVYLTPLQRALVVAMSWPNKKQVGEFNGLAAIIPKQELIKRLNPHILTNERSN